MTHKDFQCYLYFIRHGETEANLNPGIIRGRSLKTRLTKRGIEQSRTVGARFKKEGISFDRVYSSSLLRAIQTAEEICKIIGHDQQIVPTDSLIEFSQGEWEGKLHEEVYTLENLNYMNAKGSFFTPPGGGESQRMVERRASGWLEDEILYNPEYTMRKYPIYIAIVSHSITIKCLLHYMLGCDPHLIWRFTLDNCSITRFLFKKEGWFPLCINDSYHLHESS